MSKQAWVALSLSRHLGGVKMKALMESFGTAKAVLQADRAALQKVPGIGPKIAEAIEAIDERAVARKIRAWEQAGVKILTMRHDLTYPERLRELPDPPPTLFVLGRWEPPDVPTVAVVGTRTPTPVSKKTATQIGETLVERGYALVSGLAQGIDTEAHNAALYETFSVAVLGSGELNINPKENDLHADHVRSNGAIISEVAPDATVSTPNLVARNRIISGLADVVVVVETAADGGAMHAARAAHKQGRPILAVETSATGNRKLLDDGIAQPYSVSALQAALAS